MRNLPTMVHAEIKPKNPQTPKIQYYTTLTVGLTKSKTIPRSRTHFAAT